MNLRHAPALLLACALSLLAPVAWADGRGGDDDRDDDRGRDRGHGQDRSRGLSRKAYADLHASGVDKYLGRYRPAQSQVLDGGWTKHTFDPQAGEGPMCIAGTPYTAFTKARNPSKVMVYFNGGGACWQGFYNCSPFADAAPPAASGVFADNFVAGTQVIDNPLADFSVVYGSYCDGSVFSGDNKVADPAFPGGVRHHRGLRNASAVVDLARSYFPQATQVVLAGSSAGGLGASTWTPFLARFAWGNVPRLMVYNDAGPTFTNLADAAAVDARARDWAWGQSLPASCKDCNDHTHFTPLLDWRLSHDRKLREALYITDADQVLRFFLSIPTQTQFRSLLLEQTDGLADRHHHTFKRFVRSGSGVHTSWRTPLFYTATANGVPQHAWIEAFVTGDRRDWIDIVEDLVPAP